MGNHWVIKVTIAFNTKTEALKAEKFIKRKKSRAYIEAVIDAGRLL